jgi:sugar phosphate isomerase/epimerase
MNRRKFLTGTAAGAAGVAAYGITGGAQAPAAPPAAGGQGGRGGAGGPAPLIGQPGTPANVPAHKLARISLMQLNFNGVLIPNSGTPTNANQTVALMDLPKLYVEAYGVHNIEFQLDRVVKAETDPNFIKELKARLDEFKMTMSQINMEIGAAQGMTADAAGRRTGIDRLKKWVDIANQFGCKRLMLNQNQGALTKDRKADAVAYMKEVADAGRPSGVMFSVETRGGNQPSTMVDGKPVVQDLGMKPWEFMASIIEEAGANSNVDIGNVGAMDQQELNACIKRWFPTSSGNMHIKSSPNWDIGAAVRYAESLGYKGLYAIEVGAYAGQRMTYNQILANIK